MPRIARLVVPGLPHHVTQRGNRRQQTFFHAEDFITYLQFMQEECFRAEVQILGFCLMENHVHHLLLPPSSDSLRKAVGETHRRYSLMINQRNRWRGYLWQGRFFSCPIDWSSLRTVLRYIEMNPVRAGLVENPGDYPWSSAPMHIQGRDIPRVGLHPVADHLKDWELFLERGRNLPPDELEVLRNRVRTGRPVGTDEFVRSLESVTGRSILPQKAGPKGPWKWQSAAGGDQQDHAVAHR